MVVWVEKSLPIFSLFNGNLVSNVWFLSEINWFFKVSLIFLEIYFINYNLNIKFIVNFDYNKFYLKPSIWFRIIIVNMINLEV